MYSLPTPIKRNIYIQPKTDVTQNNYDNEFNYLQRQLEKQNQTIQQLLSQVRSQQIKQEHNQNFQILEEIKSLKRQIQRLENGPQHMPPVPPPMPPVFNPYAYHIPMPGYFPGYYPMQPPMQQFMPMFPPPIQGPYAEPNPYDLQEQRRQQKQLLLDFIKQGQIEIVDKKHKRKSQFKEDPEDEKMKGQKRVSQKQSSPIMTKSQRIIQPQNQTESALHRLKKQPSKRASQMSMPQQQKPRTPTLEEIRASNKEIQKKTSDDLASRYENFQYQPALTLILENAEKQKLLAKSWAFTIVKNGVSAQCQTVILLCKLCLENFLTIVKAMAQDHKNLMKQIFTPAGILWDGHSKFVASRINIEKDLKLTNIDKPQQQLILMDYLYNQVYLPNLMMVKQWYPHYQKLPQFKECLKIWWSILHLIFVQNFKGLQKYELEQPFSVSTENVFFYAENADDYNYVIQIIDKTSPNYQITDEGTILGLYPIEAVQDAFNHSLMFELQAQFEKLCEETYLNMTA